jgi:sigma-B regulation protein RsbU (phosphoserine phosphatase)
LQAAEPAAVDLVRAVEQQLEQAARVQRRLLPRTAIRIQGYDLAGSCRPANEVAGDFYDWVLSPGGDLDLTVADVMGKGMGAALVGAAMRTALRAASPALGPAARLRLAAELTPLGLDEEGLFVTLFQGRLDPASGVLRYVDAGHGHCAIRRSTGELVGLPERSLPLGVLPDADLREGTTRLEAGDTLVVYSDGLVETPERTLELSAFGEDLETASNAGEMVERLMARVPARPLDDVTVVALRRL